MKFLDDFIGDARLYLNKHSSEVLTGFAIAGMGVSVVRAITDTPKALKIIEERKNELQDDNISKIDVLKLTWKCYLPTIVTFGLSTSFLIYASRVNYKKTAALATAYSLTDRAYREYQKHTLAEVGTEREQSIRDSVAREQVEKNPVGNEVIVLGQGKTLCHDPITGGYFESDIETIRRAENTLNKRMIDEMYVSLGDFFDEIGMKHSGSIGEDLGWNIQNGTIDLYFSSQITDDGRPCLVVGHKTPPTYKYWKM